MRFEDKGSFTWKEKNGEIWTIIYCKTNYLLKKHPGRKMIAIKDGTFVEKMHSPNKIWYSAFDSRGLDYIGTNDYTAKEVESILKHKDIVKLVDFKDVNSAEELYIIMKESGLKPKFTKKWFENRFNFIKTQMSMI